MVSSICPFVSEIIPGKLYLGSKEGAQDKELLSQLGITHILNVTKSVEFSPCNRIRYKRISIEDGDQGIQQYFNESFNFIERGRVVLVHCRQGVSRSASIVIAYLMKKNAWDLPQSLKYVRSIRQIVSPHFNFMIGLENFGKTLKS